MLYLEGDIFTVDGFIKGYVQISQDHQIDICKGTPPEKPEAKGIIVPAFVNAHTHLGDAFLHDKVHLFQKDVKQLVAPPDGLKHQFLKTASDQEIIQGMQRAMNDLKQSGTTCFCDFREGGIRGVSQIQSVLKNQSLSSLILARPDTLAYRKDEVDMLLKNAEGIGISSISDWSYDEAQKLARQTKQKNKLFALHASEIKRENIDLILDLHPDFLIHMNQATEADLLRVKDENIPIVLCPRSNHFFNLKLDFLRLKKTGITLLLGTDNAMLHPPNILDELRFLQKITTVFSFEELLNMITYHPRKVLNLEDGIPGLNPPDNYVVLRRKNLEILYQTKTSVEG